MVKGSSRCREYISKAYLYNYKVTEQHFQNINYKCKQIKKEKKNTLKIIINVSSKLSRLKRQL